MIEKKETERLTELTRVLTLWVNTQLTPLCTPHCSIGGQSPAVQVTNGGLPHTQLLTVLSVVTLRMAKSMERGKGMKNTS